MEMERETLYHYDKKIPLVKRNLWSFFVIYAVITRERIRRQGKGNGSVGERMGNGFKGCH